MNLMVTLNRNYRTPLIVLLKSLVDCHPQERFTVYILHSSLVEEDFAEILQRVNSDRCQLESIWVEDSALADAPIGYHFTKEMYYRIFAARLLPQNLDRILYLDPDMVVINPLDELYRTEMGDHFFVAAASLNKRMQKIHLLRLGLPEDGIYFNSGMMLFNLQALRQEQNYDRVLQYIHKNKEILQLPDQDLLNALYGSRTIIVDPLYYNFDVRYFPYYSLLPSGRRMVTDWVEEHTCILHYCGKSKPFKSGYSGPMGEYYTRIADQLALSPIDVELPPIIREEANEPDSIASLGLSHELESLIEKMLERWKSKKNAKEPQ